MSTYTSKYSGNEIDSAIQKVLGGDGNPSLEQNLSEIINTINKTQSWVTACPTSNVTFSGSSLGTVNFGTIRSSYDPLGLFEIGSSSNTITVKQSGTVEVSAGVYFVLPELTGLQGDSFITMRVNNKDRVTQRRYKATRSGSEAPWLLAFEPMFFSVNANDYFNTYIWTGGVPNAVAQGNSASYYSYINIKYIN